MVRILHLGGNPEAFSQLALVETQPFQAFANLALVSIAGGSINMAIASPQGALHHIGSLAVFHAQNTQANLWYEITIAQTQQWRGRNLSRLAQIINVRCPARPANLRREWWDTSIAQLQ